MPYPPLTTWEQLGVVVVFVFLLLAFMAGFFALARSILKTVQEISGQFQSFIAARDKQWQEYFEDREQSFKERNGEITKVLERLLAQFADHAEETNRAIATMEERTARKTKPRSNS